ERVESPLVQPGVARAAAHDAGYPFGGTASRRFRDRVVGRRVRGRGRAVEGAGPSSGRGVERDQSDLDKEPSGDRGIGFQSPEFVLRPEAGSETASANLHGRVHSYRNEAHGT